MVRKSSSATPSDVPVASPSAYGFASVTLSNKLAARADASGAIGKAILALERLSAVLALAADIPMAQARLLCGLGGRLSLALDDPSEFPDGTGARFDPRTSVIHVSGTDDEGMPACGHLAHEWAHGLDYTLGLGNTSPRLGASAQSTPVGSSRYLGVGSVAEASRSAAPYQSIIGALASGKAQHARADDFYASIGVAQGQKSTLPAFTRLASSMLPGIASTMRTGKRSGRMVESALQENRLIDFAHSSALECLRSDPALAALSLPEKKIETLAKFCARAVVSRSARESSRRRGREEAIDSAKADIHALLRGALRLSDPDCARLATSIMHIVPMKERYPRDGFYAAPYTGRSHWDAPGSLADLACALVRVGRNQRALANSRLAKEKFVPMSFWWSMRRHVSEISSEIDSRALGIVDHLVAANAIRPEVASHARQWGGKNGAYKAGALVFSDLIGTGAKMIQSEAVLMGKPIGVKEALSLRRKIAAPINDLAKRKTIVESIAESFEQFVQHQSRKPTRLGKACKKAVESHLVDSDKLEGDAGLDPSLCWMHNKDGDALGNSRRWRAVLREAASLMAPLESHALDPALPAPPALHRASRPRAS